MADEQTPETAEESSKGGLPMMTLAVVGGALLLQVGVIAAVFFLAGGPAPVQAEGAIPDAEADANRLVEVLLVKGKFQNTKTGRTYFYDTEVFIVVKQKHQEQVEGYIESMTAQISEDTSIIFRRAEPSHLLEPTLNTLKRMIKASVDEKFGRDEEGLPIVEKVLITKFSQYRADV